MINISMIAAIDEDRGLGINNQLLCHLPADLQHFKNITMGKPIIMGRKTFESIGKPLPGRLNVVISHTIDQIDGATVVNSLDKAINLVSDQQEAMIIGGEKLFKEAINIATRMYITHIHQHFLADVFFPIINETEWDCIEKQYRQHDERNQYDMTFCTYQRGQKK